MKKTASAILFAAALLFAFSQCTGSGSGQVTANQAEIDSLRAQIASLTATNEAIAKNLDKFDTLDFTIFSNQEWARFHESHAPDIRVYWPDGRLTEGLDIHIEDLKKLFVHAPDTRIKQHPIRFGAGRISGPILQQGAVAGFALSGALAISAGGDDKGECSHGEGRGA